MEGFGGLWRALTASLVMSGAGGWGGVLEAYLESRGAGGSNVVPLSEERVTIGRAIEAGVSLADDPTVSRLHASVERYPGGWVLRDLGSTNGTYLNGDRVLEGRPLASDDEIRVGAATFRFRIVAPQSRAAPTIRGESPPSLTKREREVLLELCRPLADTTAAFGRPATVGEIAGRLYIGSATVKFHLDNLFTKFGLTDAGGERRITLANEALRRGALTIAELRAGPGSGPAN
ncbi:MAG: FHA domain-containing protein [Acidimicrobiales bacterium]